MNTEQNIAAVKKAYEAFKCGNIQAVLSMMSEDVSWTAPEGRSLIPFSRPIKGRAGVARFFEALAASEVELTFEPHQFVAEGDSVVAFVHYWARARATGKSYEGEGVHLFRFQNGQIAGFREFFDAALMGPAMARHDRAESIHCKFCS